MTPTWHDWLALGGLGLMLLACLVGLLGALRDFLREHDPEDRSGPRWPS